MSIWNRIFGDRTEGRKTASCPPQIDQTKIDELEKQLHLSPDYDVIDGVYNGTMAKQHLQNRGIQPPDTPLPLTVFDTSKMRFSDRDKNLPKRIDAAKKLARIESLQAFLVLQKALDTEHSKEVQAVIRRGIKKLGKKVVSLVIPLLDDETWAKRMQAVKLLGLINDKTARTALKNRLSTEKDYDIRCEIESLLGEKQA